MRAVLIAHLGVFALGSSSLRSTVVPRMQGPALCTSGMSMKAVNVEVS